MNTSCSCKIKTHRALEQDVFLFSSSFKYDVLISLSVKRYITFI